MAEHENTAGDPLEEAFNAPAAEGHPEAEESPAVADAAAGKPRTERGSTLRGCETRGRTPGQPASPAGGVHELQEPCRPRERAASGIRGERYCEPASAGARRY